MLKNYHIQPKHLLVACFIFLLAGTFTHVTAAETKSEPIVVTRWTCNAFYLPARSIWQRTVDLEFDGKDVRAVQIDGVPVYAFNIQGTIVLTAVDGERIQFDPVAQTWASDLRGVVSSQGRCDR